MPKPEPEPPVLDPDNEDDLLDEGLEESFPASDPPSITRPHPSAPPAPNNRKDGGR